MKISHKIAAVLLSLIVAGSAVAQPSKQIPASTSSSTKASKAEEPCAICARLAKSTPPVAVKVGGHVYDPNRACHRELRFKPTANGKGPQFASECFCS